MEEEDNNNKFRQDRLKALAAPLVAAGKIAEEIQSLPTGIISSTLNSPALNQTKQKNNRIDSVATPYSRNQDEHSKILEIGSILSVSPRRSGDEISADVVRVFDVQDEDDFVTAIARKLGLETQDKSRISLLESIGDKLGLPKPFFFDQNLYYAKAEEYWVENIARKLGVRLNQTDDEILRNIGRKLGMKIQENEKYDIVLNKIALKLGLSLDDMNQMDPLEKIEQIIKSRKKLV